MLSKAEKKCAGLIRDLMKRKGGAFFESAVDPSSDESGGLADYFEKVFPFATQGRCARPLRDLYLLCACRGRVARHVASRLSQVLLVLAQVLLVLACFISLPTAQKCRKCRR